MDEVDLATNALSDYPLLMTEDQVCEAMGLTVHMVRKNIPRADFKNRCLRYKKTDVVHFYIETKSSLRGKSLRSNSDQLGEGRSLPRGKKFKYHKKPMTFHEALEAYPVKPPKKC